jgi:hypothetical protein
MTRTPSILVPLVLALFSTLASAQLELNYSNLRASRNP